jgi:hypothetical protein
MVEQLDPHVGGPCDQHPPHAADLCSVEVGEDRVGEVGVRGVAGSRGVGIAGVDRDVEPFDRRVIDRLV